MHDVDHRYHIRGRRAPFISGRHEPGTADFGIKATRKVRIGGTVIGGYSKGRSQAQTLIHELLSASAENASRDSGNHQSQTDG